MNLLTPRQKLQRLVAIANELRELFANCDPSIAVDGATTRVQFHNCGDYAYATNLMRGLGFGKRDKQTMPSGKSGKTAINGISDEFKLIATAYCNQLPPTCKIVEYEVETPAKKTTTVGTKKVIRRRIECLIETD